ncbi:MAG: SsrA-binding protein [Ectothiorhodospiraceae bacterium]|nr:SsrA-binding protein [Ectothiorhodospiraceae bacterium]
MNQQNTNEQIKTIATNRKARHEYHVLESVETGIVLVGTEVKSIRAGKVSFQDAYAAVESGELWLHSLHISPFEKGNVFNHDPVRKRKLLASKREIKKLHDKTAIRGYTLIPLVLYFKGRYLKVELGVCKGKKFYDKRETVKQRDIDREMKRNIKI